MMAALQRKNANTFPIVELYTVSSLNNMYVEGVQNGKYELDVWDDEAMWYYRF